jgi:lipopolysaccharide export system protein LptC
LQIDSHGAHPSLRAHRIDAERMFRRAMRHSRMVRMLRVGVPLGLVLGTAATFVVVTLLNPLQALVKLPVDISSLVVSGTKITMQAPRLVGYTRDNRPYSLTARAAAQDITNPNLLELQDIRATMETQDKGAFKLLANSGIYDSKADKLTLRQNIVITSDNYEGHLTEAFVEARKGYILSEKPVEVRMQQGKINANRLEVEQSGDVIRFGRGVTMVMTTDALNRDPAEGADRKTADAAQGRRGGQ